MLSLPHRLISQSRIALMSLEGNPPPHLDMMRDHCRAARAALRNGCPVVVVDNVAQYMADQEKAYWHRDELPGCMPPFDLCFVTWAQPAVMTMTINGAPRKVERRELSLVQHGVLAERHAVSELVDDINRAALKHGKPGVNPSAKYEVRLTHFGTDHGGNAVTYGLLLVIFLDERGTIVGGWGCEDSHSAMIVAEMAFSFMNCKNVVLEDATEREGPPRKWLRRMKQPAIRYHTINIEPMKRVLRSEGGVETHGIKHAFHICRGHFRTYDEAGGGLFGRGQTGTFWVAQHSRGNEKHGKVVANYNVIAPHGWVLAKES